MEETRKHIFIIGAGRSSSTMIDYLLKNAEVEGWNIVIGDFVEKLAVAKAGNYSFAKGIKFDIHDDAQRKAEIAKADLVISLLPPHMHIIPARDCLAFETHLVTASYVSDEMAALDAEAKAKNLLFLNEIGVDPGIDHMSAMEMVERVRAKGGKLISFKSYCGALVAPESNNEWGYKFTWAPRNIILAGQGVARYLRQGMVKYLPYHRLFGRHEEIEVPGTGVFEAYANRDSVKYLKLYDLEGIETLYRATLRYPGYCEMWDAFVQMGMTESKVNFPNSASMTLHDFTFSFINPQPGLTDVESLAFFLEQPVNSLLVKKLLDLGLLSDQVIGLDNASPADILEKILMEKWVFEDDDTDMVVMQHQIEYELDNVRRKMVSSMVDKGQNAIHTAVSRTVGLPAAIAARHILQGNIATRGVAIPTTADIYAPILEELKEYDIFFIEEEFMVSEAELVH